MRAERLVRNGVPLGWTAVAVLVAGWTALAVSMHLRHTEDVCYYRRSAGLVLHGFLPYRDFSFVYPPLALLPCLIPFVFSLGRGQPLWVYGGLFVAENAVWTAVLGLLIARCAGTGEFPCTAASALCGYAALVVLAATVLPLRYDMFPALLTGLALWCIVREHPGRAGIFLGLGVAAKLYPVVLWPILALYYGTGKRFRALWRLTAGCLAALAVTLAPFAGLKGPVFVSSLEYHLRRGLEVESVAAGALLLAGRLGLTTTACVFNYGAIHLVCPWAGGWLRTLPVAFAVGYGLLLAGCARRFREERRTTGSIRVSSLTAFFGAALLVFMLANKVFSPQYILWLLPFLPLAGPAFRTPGVALFALTLLVFPIAWNFLLDRDLGAILLLNLRNGVALVLAVRLARPPTPRPRQEPPAPGSAESP